MRMFGLWLILPVVVACGKPPSAAPAPPAPPAQATSTEKAPADRAARQAASAFWNQPASVAELGLTVADRQRLDALVPGILAALQQANRNHRATTEAWAAAVRSGDTAATERLARELAASAAAVSRAQIEAKTGLVAALGPGPAQKLAERYPKFLAAPWVRANRLVDTTSLGKWLED